MTRLQRARTWGALLSVAVVASLAAALAQSPAPNHRRIAVFGSSVANGTGDELAHEGYTGRLRDLLAASGWEVLNQSRGGDNTVRIAPRFEPDGAPEPNTRYLVTVDPRYALIGLSLGNEGIGNTTVRAEQDAVFRQFETGMRDLVARSRARGIVPVITLCYTRNTFTEVEYEYTRRMNLLINTWDVPSVNFLGAVDDGTGKWVDGFWSDALHPNAAGHEELTATIVPTLFDALERGIPMPTRPGLAAFARVTGGRAPLTFEPSATMHPFAVAFSARATGDGTVAMIGGRGLMSTSVEKQVAAGRGTTRSMRSVTLTPSFPLTVGVGIVDGRWTYRAVSGAAVASTVSADTNWHDIVVSHYAARGETLFFVDGQLAGTVAERIQPERFVIGGPGASTLTAAPPRADYKDVFIFRSALNVDEVAALHAGTVLQASLEVYAPLAEAGFEAGRPAENRAQSLATLGVGSDAVIAATQ